MTLPLLLAIGLAVALTPPTSVAYAAVGKTFKRASRPYFINFTG